ncbi:MAG: pitrilysin family protein [Desulfobaccales bacterium]
MTLLSRIFNGGGRPGAAAALRRVLLAAVLTAIGLSLAAPADLRAQAGPNLFDQVVEHKLDNGLKVLLLKETRAPIITLQLWYRVGSRNECLGKTGISHVAEYMLFKGTARYGPKYFSREVGRVGGSDNAFTSRDYTAFFETGPKDQLKHWLEMEADRMKGINVNEEGFQTDKKVVLEERRLTTDDDPQSFMEEAALAATFEAHPYQWPVIGWQHDIESISLEDYQQYYHRYYQPNNCTLVVVGDIEPKEALKEIEDTVGDLPAGPEPPKVTAQEPPQYGERLVWVHREAQFPYLLMSYHTPNWQTPEDAYPLELLSRILSEGHSSRLYHDLVYEQKLALKVGADYDLYTCDPFLFMLSGQPMPGKTLAQLQAGLDTEIKRLQTELVSPRELLKAKNQASAEFYLHQDSIFFRGMLLGETESVARWTLLKEYIPKLTKVTAADVRRVAQKYLVPMNCTLGLLAPVKTGKPEGGHFHPGGAIR